MFFSSFDVEDVFFMDVSTISGMRFWWAFVALKLKKNITGLQLPHIKVKGFRKSSLFTKTRSELETYDDPTIVLE